MSDVPRLLPPEEMPPITDQASLEHTWRALMGELGFGFPQVWLLFIEDDRGGPVLVIDHVPLAPRPEEIEVIGHMIGHLVDDGARIAFLYARPGHGRTAGDLAWARGLGSLLPCSWPVHLANDTELRVAAPDDLLEAS